MHDVRERILVDVEVLQIGDERHDE
jgi:hypothetical protein